MARFWFYHKFLLKLWRVRRKNNENFGNAFFILQVFQTFGNSEIDFGISLKKILWKIINTCSYVTLVLTHWKKNLKHYVTMPSHQRYCLTYIYGFIKFHFPKVRGSWVIGVQKCPISRNKIMLLFGKCLELIKINKTLTF